MNKLSVIRGKDVVECPYALKIPTACHLVGDTIKEMRALSTANEKDAKEIASRNRIIYYTQKTGKQCPYAQEILDKFSKVDCNWGDEAAGEHTGYMPSSPFYPSTFIGTGITPNPRSGQNITDPRNLWEEPERGIDVPFGLYSIFSNQINKQELIKIANKYTNKVVNIEDIIVLLENNYFPILKKMFLDSPTIKLSNKQLEHLLVVVSDWTTKG